MLSHPLTKELLHTTDAYIKSLYKWWIQTIADLIYFFPKDTEDRTNVLESFSYVNTKEKNTLLLTFISIENTKLPSWKLLTKAVFEDKNGFMSEWVWFNRNYLATQLNKCIWKKVILSGKVKYEFWKLSFISPDIETDLSKTKGEVLALYSDCNYIPWSWIASKMPYIRNYISLINETLPQNIVEKYQFLSKSQAIEKLHFPLSNDDFEMARQRLAYDELYDINFISLSKKIQRQNDSEWNSIAIPLDIDCMKNLIATLPFSLTNHQKISLFQVLKDMEKTHCMQRLLQGDVWTGKTIIATLASIHCFLQTAKNNKKIQISFMAPTEILARQHFEWLESFFTSYGIHTVLLVGSTTKKEKEIIKEQLKCGDIDCIIWTHALLEEDVIFHRLWLVIIDEQHRFWVKQREILEKYASWGIFPHVLNMTATPIPRTLALTLYGDQDVSIINEYPEWRKNIFTKVIRHNEQRQQVELFIKNQIEAWRQVFWVSPLVEESEKIDLANAIQISQSLTEIFFPYKIWLLHGKMKAKDKQAIMEQFTKNEIQILSSTSVIEVWVNIPNASIICIEWAERFWLSQLHQFRWRVGRWQYQSYCYLFPTHCNMTDRLKAMEKTNNGFELAQIDLELRWPWEVYGVRQSWVVEFKIAQIHDLEKVSQIREDIEDLLWVKREKNI
jgi:ATP-dependent DNA helicase RecG